MRYHTKTIDVDVFKIPDRGIEISDVLPYWAAEYLVRHSHKGGWLVMVGYDTTSVIEYDDKQFHERFEAYPEVALPVADEPAVAPLSIPADTDVPF